MKPAIIWDWDGTLTNSIPYKYDGVWNEVFKDEPDKQAVVRSYLKTTAGKSVTRYGLIAYTLIQTDAPEMKDWGSEKLQADERVGKYASKYDQATKAHIYGIGLFEGAEVLLQKLHRQGYMMFLISGGGTDSDLREIATRLKVETYFRDIFGFGSGGSIVKFGKSDNYARAQALCPEAQAYLVIGDSQTDYEFAQKIEAKFIGIASPYTTWKIGGEPFPVVYKLSELYQYIIE